MNLKVTLFPLITRSAAVAAICMLGMGVVHQAHAGASVENSPVAVLLPAVQETHTQTNCVYHPEGYKTCTISITHTVGVTGYGFTPGGTVILYLINAQTGVTRKNLTLTATILPAGTISMDFGNSWCSSHGWAIKAYDAGRQRFSNTVSVAPCSTP